jgi:WS/DGAT/MGAT family acyltransferase
MRHLSALDALFLQLETPDTPMHVGSLMVLAQPAGKRDPYDAIRALMTARMHLAPVFVSRLAPVFGDIANPAWIDAEVDLDYHMRRLTLPRPGTRAQLEAAVARLHEGMLDRTRPLWQVTVIDGLESGEVGYYSKIHHAALDGQGGVAVAQAILDTSPRIPRAPRAAAPPRMPPTTARLLGSALRHTVARYGAIVKAIPDFAVAAARGGAVALTATELRKSGLALGPRTRLNEAIGHTRLFTTVQIPLAECKAIARHYGAKLNDVVLATCAEALRLQFKGDKAALAKAMVAAVPVSLRAPGDTGPANNVSMMFVSIATQVADPGKRMAAIVAASTRAKTLTGSMKGAIPTDMPSLGIPWLMARITPLYRKAVASDRVPVLANLVISNVPGPQVPLYLAGMRLNAYYPVSIVTHGLGLNVTILSYDGSLDYGIVAAKSAMPDIARFARNLKAAHRGLLATTRRRTSKTSKTSKISKTSKASKAAKAKAR